MADAIVERRPAARFFCHRCNVEFEDVLQDYTCPYCASGFIEQLEAESDSLPISGDDFSDADMSNIDDMSNVDEASLAESEEIPHLSQIVPPMLNDLAFLMSGGRRRGTGHRETIMEQLVLMIGGGRPESGAVTAGAPFVLVGAPGDYVFGGEGLDAVVTQLLGQLENSGPPPLPREQIAALPSEVLAEGHPAANTSCSVCWEDFVIGETVSRLECEHVFHSACIAPWLQLHATCPICRRSLLPDEPSSLPAPLAAPLSPTMPAPQLAPQPAPRPHLTFSALPASATNTSATTASNITSVPQLLVRRFPRRGGAPTWRLLGSSSSSASMSSNPSETPAPASTSSSSTTSSTEHSNQYNMDIDYD